MPNAYKPITFCWPRLSACLHTPLAVSNRQDAKKSLSEYLWKIWRERYARL